MAKGWRTNEALKEVLKGPNDEGLKEWISEIFEIWIVDVEGMSSEDISPLVVVKYFSKLREGVLSLAKVEMSCHFPSISFKAVAIGCSR